MKRIQVEINKDGSIETNYKEYKKVFANDRGYSVYEETKTGALEVFDDKRKFFTMGKLEEITVGDWLKDKYFAKILFTMYTDKPDSEALKAIREEAKKYISANYGFLANVDYEAIKLEV